MNPSFADVSQQLSYDPHTGVFVWLVNRTGTARKGTRAGSLKAGGYRQILVCGKRLMEHRLAFLMMTGSIPSDDIDHINGDPADNRWGNLRAVSVSVNMQNQRNASRSKQSSLLGSYWHKRIKRWQACIMTNGKLHHIGYFDTEMAAHLAYVAEKRVRHPGCTL